MIRLLMLGTLENTSFGMGIKVLPPKLSDEVSFNNIVPEVLINEPLIPKVSEPTDRFPVMRLRPELQFALVFKLTPLGLFTFRLQKLMVVLPNIV